VHFSIYIYFRGLWNTGLFRLHSSGSIWRQFEPACSAGRRIRQTGAM